MAKRKRQPAELLTVDEVRGLMKACSRRAPSGIRNRALLAVLWRCGLRIGEALALDPKDIDAKGGTVRVLHGKGDKARTVPVDEETLAVLERWTDKRRALGINGRARLFCTLTGGPLSTTYARALFARLKRRTGIEKRCHPHALRHRCAMDLLDEGWTVAEIQVQLGHASPGTTATYLNNLMPKHIIDKGRARRWPASPDAA